MTNIELNGVARKYVTNDGISDAYYTSEEVAKWCVDILLKKIGKRNVEKYVFLEPSAGSGVFSELLDCVAIDINPASDKVMKYDFLKSDPKEYGIGGDKNVCVFGNPPFGRNASLAVKFFNKAAEFSKIIAFIVPKTFKKISVQNRLNRKFMLVYSEDLPKDSFVVKGQKWDVPCVFQIWKKGSKDRKIDNRDTCDWFEFVGRNEGDVVVRRAGGRAGSIIDGKVEDATESTNYFLKLKMDKVVFERVMRKIDFKEVVSNTAGVRSVSKTELIKMFEENL